MAVNYDINDPSDADVAFPDVAGEIRQVYTDFQEILNSIFTNNTLPAVPATLVNYDAQIPNVGVVPAPSRIRGDRVDLRGYTWRRGSVTDASSRSTSSTTFSPVGNPGGAAGTGAFNITITPVSSSSLLEFHYTLFARCTNTAGDIGGDATRRGEFRLFNVTSAAEITNARAVCHVQTSGASNGGWMSIHGYGQTTGISGANQIEIQFASMTAAGSNTLYARGDLIASVFNIIESV